MALTLTPAPGGIEVSGNKVTRTWNAVFTTYTAGGEPLTPRQLGLISVDFLDIEPSGLGDVTLAYDYNTTPPKLRAFTSTAPGPGPGAEVSGGSDLSWMLTIRLRARGLS